MDLAFKGQRGAIMRACSYRMVTLLEILETSAEAWWRLASMTGQMMVKLETELPPLDSVVETLSELRGECVKLKLVLAQASLALQLRLLGIV
jgi:hypothetical protein